MKVLQAGLMILKIWTKSDLSVFVWEVDINIKSYLGLVCYEGEELRPTQVLLSFWLEFYGGFYLFGLVCLIYQGLWTFLYLFDHFYHLGFRPTWQIDERMVIVYMDLLNQRSIYVFLYCLVCLQRLNNVLFEQIWSNFKNLPIWYDIQKHLKLAL